MRLKKLSVLLGVLLLGSALQAQAPPAGSPITNTDGLALEQRVAVLTLQARKAKADLKREQALHRAEVLILQLQQNPLLLLGPEQETLRAEEQAVEKGFRQFEQETGCRVNRAENTYACPGGAKEPD
jgi:hypothetical protein